MDRSIVYPAAQGRSTDILFAQRAAMVGLAKLSEAVLGTTTLIDGLAVTQTASPSMAVSVAPGQIYMLTSLDATAYSGLAADTTHSIVKQGISLDSQSIALAAPGTVGYSINYLIQATYQDSDTNNVVLPYFNSANPSMPLSGQNNSGSAQATERHGVCVVTSKAGTAATTGTQTTPSPDSGYVGIAVVTVAYGASSIVNGNISAYSGSPIITERLGDKISQATGDLRYALVGTSSPVQGAFKNLQASATGTNATVTVSADEISVEDSSNAYKTLRSVSLSINSAAAGANGLDSGTLAGSTWYAVWVISNGTTTAGLLSTSATAPTMPSGYTYKARIGWIRTDGTANKYPLGFVQSGRRVNYKIASGSNVAALPLMASGVLGTYSVTAPTWSAVSLSGFVPATASQASIVVHNSYNGATISSGNVAPSNAYSGTNTTNPPPCVLGSAGTDAKSIQYIFAIESSNLYAASNAAGFAIQSYGWEDNL